MLEMVLLSYAGDGVAGATWPRRDVDIDYAGDGAAGRLGCDAM
jgi:hypothetical protein